MPIIPPYSITDAAADRPASRILLEAPHNSFFDPAGTVPHDRLMSHEGYDIGAKELSHFLQAKLNAYLVESNRSRLYVEHNRTQENTLAGILDNPDTEEARLRIAQDYRPYIEAVDNEIKTRFVELRELPIMLCIHTYTTVLNNGKRRMPFNVEGEEGDVFIKVLREKVKARFDEAAAAGRLAGISALDKSQGDFDDPVTLNGPYNLNSHRSDGTENPEVQRVMSPHFTQRYGFAWALLETRNDIAKEPVVQQIVLAALQDVLADKRMQDDLAARDAGYFIRSVAMQEVA
jgi:predicted N-formylglutamate amidohydrolase